MNHTLPLLNRRILVIDDNQAIHDDFRKILGESDAEDAALDEAEARIFGKRPNMLFEIDTVFQGEEGVRKLEESVAEGRPYAMAFVDVRMPPGWDGIETTQRLWRLCPDLQVVICTAFADHSWNEMRSMLGNMDHLLILKKPFDTFEILQMASALTQKWLMLQESRLKLDGLETVVSERTRELEASQAAAVSMMADAIHHREKAEEAYESLQLEMTARKQADEALRMQGRVLECMAEGVTVCDENGHVVFSNAAFNAMFGYDNRELIGQHFSVLKESAPDEARREVDSLWQGLQERGAWTGEIASRKKDGLAFVIRARVSVVANAGTQSFIFVVEDITEKKNMEAQFLRSQRMESVGRLSSGVAHDMNNILTPITLAATLLRRPLPAEDFERLLGGIETSAQRGAALVKQLLTLSCDTCSQRKVVPADNLIGDMMQIMKGTFPKSVSLSSRIPLDLWPVLGDATQLHQVLLNLCVNAGDAMPLGGTLTISAENVRFDDSYAAMTAGIKPGPYVMFTVTDTGEGIPSDIKDKIFDPFFTTKETGKGTGLGLSTVMGIVKGHQGFVNCRSLVGAGTTFEVCLPAVPDAVPDIASLARPAPPAGQGETILVVDDEASIRDVLRKTLVGHGYRVLTAGDGTEAVVTFAQHRDEIKAVLTDIMMPYMDGVTMVRTMRKMAPATKIVASTGMGSARGREDKTAALHALGVRTLLTKPYTADEVLCTLGELLSKPEEAAIAA